MKIKNVSISIYFQDKNLTIFMVLEILKKILKCLKLKIIYLIINEKF